MIKSLKLLWKFYFYDWKKQKLWQKVLMPVATFLLILFVFAFLAFYIVQIYYQTAAFQYATYDVELLNASPQQMAQIKQYDYVEKWVGYASVSGVLLKNGEKDIGVNLIALKSNTLCDLEYTPCHSRLAIEKDDSIMANTLRNPIAVCESDAKRLNVKVGDIVHAIIGEVEIEYTVAGVYEDALSSVRYGVAYVLNQGDLLNWMIEIDVNSGETNVSEETIGCSHAYVTFNDDKKGQEMIQNYVADITLYPRYGENWRTEATVEELQYYAEKYETREEMVESRRNNSLNSFSNVVWLVLFGGLALALFIFWERNRTVTLTEKGLTVLVAEGCSKMGLFAYFFGSTFLRQLGYFILTIPIVQYPFMALISTEYTIYHFSGFLLLQCLPIVLGFLLLVSLLTGAFLYIKFARKLILFTGEE